MGELLNKANTPEGLKQLDERELPRLAEEMREFIIDSVHGRTGGHLGSGLGALELTLALHYHFEFRERDSLFLDVGHQCYPHKILTGRRDSFGTLRQHHGLSGFPDPKESEYDRVKTGHGGTSLSSAVGVAVANKLAGRTDAHSVALIGDGALQEGQALEALNHAGELRDIKLLYVLNDNEHGIGPATGALAQYLGKFRSSPAYTNAKKDIKKLLHALEDNSGKLGRAVLDVVDHVKTGMHSLLPRPHPGVLFEELGFFYFGPIDGHDIEAMLGALRAVENVDKPIVLHVMTRKGKGFNNDEPDHYAYHAAKPPAKITQHLPVEHSRIGGPAYTDVFVDESFKLFEADEKVCAITAAMLQGTGLQKVFDEYPDRVFDVGMAEQHAVGFAQGLKLGKMKPICSVYSTFMQRSVDQIFQELALIKTPVMMCLDRAGLVGPDGATHNGVFDIAYCTMLPNVVVMAPRDATELRKMMRFGVELDLPSAVRFPRTKTPKLDLELADTQPIELGKAEVLREGDDGVVFAYGSMVYSALDALEKIEERYGKRLKLINARFAKPLDQTLFAHEIENQPVVFTVEEHVRRGGFGSSVLEFANQARLDTTKIEVLAIGDHFVDHGQRVQVLMDVDLHPDGIAASIAKRLGLAKKSANSSSSRRESVSTSAKA